MIWYGSMMSHVLQCTQFDGFRCNCFPLGASDVSCISYTFAGQKNWHGFPNSFTHRVKEFGNPCQFFCPANVYEIQDTSDAPSGKQLHLNPSNCVHCKTCDIMDPYQIITWVPPEGGGGPNYDGM